MIIIVLLMITIFIAIILVYGLYQKNTNVFCKSKKRLDNKTIIITGGSCGMGKEIAIDLAERGGKVLIACPFKEEGENAAKDIIEATENEKVIFMSLDLGSLTSVRQFACEVLKTEDRLDILINNAGIGFGECLTDDGLNLTMQVNYFGHFLLTILLLPLLIKTGQPSEPSRIVNTASALHKVGKVDVNNLNKISRYLPIQSYNNSKLCLILFAKELSKMLKETHVVINSLEPGNVGTKIFQSFGWLSGGFVTFVFGTFFKSPYEGAQTALYVALDNKAGKTSGEYYKDCALFEACETAYDDMLAKRLFDKTIELVKLSDKEFDRCFQIFTNV